MKIKNRKIIYSHELGIDLESGEEKEVFKWFLACLLFGKPIQQEVAKKAYEELEREDILSVDDILNASWKKLVEVLDRGHYVRFDYSTATKLLEVCDQLKREYGGKITALIKQASDKKDLEKKLRELKGVGPVTARIFLRDLKVSGIK